VFRKITYPYDGNVSGEPVYNYFRDYSPEIGRYLESDPIGLDGGINTYAYARRNPLSFIDPDGLCPPMFDTGQFTGRIWSDKCFRKGSAAKYKGQDRTQIVGTLVGQEGDCNCQKTVTCIYDTTFYNWVRQTPCGGGAFSPWANSGPGPTRRLRVPLDCETGKFFSPRYPIPN
jgi:RHS repeat-associated protein